MQIGLGSSVGSISTAISSEGGFERTDNAFDLKIGGSSFFIVNSAGNTFFTRAGNFKVDESGALVTPGGANVMGWQVDESGNAKETLYQSCMLTVRMLHILHQKELHLLR